MVFLVADGKFVAVHSEGSYDNLVVWKCHFSKFNAMTKFCLKDVLINF